eukprot:374737_1
MRAFNFNRLLSAIIVILLQHATVSTQYILVEQHALYTEASEYCQATYGTFLASIHSWDDNYQAQLACKDSCPSCSSNWRHGCFIGLNDILNERNTDKTGWVWQDGSAFDFSEAWRGSEPNNYGGAEDCVFIFGSDHLTIDYRGKWADVPCESGDFNSYASYFLCNDPQTRNPSAAPTNIPTNNPSMPPSTAIPSPGPTNSPSHNPSVQPTTHPSHNPSHNPSKNPSKNPSNNPSNNPSKNPIATTAIKSPVAEPSEDEESQPQLSNPRTIYYVIAWACTALIVCVSLTVCVCLYRRCTNVRKNQQPTLDDSLQTPQIVAEDSDANEKHQMEITMESDSSDDNILGNINIVNDEFETVR